MEILNSGYETIPKPEFSNFIISDSFKKELKRCISLELKKMFGSKLNPKKIFLQFLDNFGNTGRACSKESLFLIPDPVYNQRSYAPYFCVGYQPHFSHNPKLIVENLKGTQPIIDPTQDVEPNSLKMTLEFSESDFKSLNELAEKEFIRKKGAKLEGYHFEVRVKDLNVDCIFRIYLNEKEFDQEKILNLVGDAISQYNSLTENNKHQPILKKSEKNMGKKVFDEQAAIEYFTSLYAPFGLQKMVPEFVESYRKQIEEHNSKVDNTLQDEYEIPSGIIHSLDLLTTKTKKVITIKVDLGSSTHGLDYILKKLDESDYPIEEIEIKGESNND